jgi:hypothetical protein
MKKFAVFLVLGFLFACSSHPSNNSQGSNPQESNSQSSNSQNAGTQATVLHSTNMTFRAAENACTGALGSITFNLGHARALAARGIELTETPESSNGIATMTFSDKATGKTATVSVNGHNTSVIGKNVTAKMNRSVACIEAG